MDLKEVIALRRTCRRYQEKQISESQLQQILLAAQTAPLATGDDKTTHLTIIQDSTVLDAIRKCCMMSTKKGSPVDPFYGAPTVIFVSATDISSDHIEYSNADRKSVV
jgi:nitroreductase